MKTFRKFYFVFLFMCAASVQSKIVIAWDIHDTLIKPHITSMVYAALTTAPLSLIKLSCSASFGALKYIALRGQKNQALVLLSKIYGILHTHRGSTAEAYKQILDEYDPVLWNIALSISCAMRPIEGIEEVVAVLHEKGYEQIIASNIGSHEFDGLMKRMPQLFQYLNPGITVNYENPVKKPALEYFVQLNTIFNPANENTIIFIDDKYENVLAAQQSGMIGILFTDISHLIHDLQSIALL